jgi:acetyl-CoA C-acetyltransferase
MDAYIVDYLRTPFSRSRPREPEKDVYNRLRMDEAMALLIRELVKRNAIRPHEVDDVLVGCALPVSENWSFGGRHPVLLSGLPPEVPSAALDRQCASSLQAVALGAMEIMTGNSHIVLAGGYEHMTHVPMVDNPHIQPSFRLLSDPAYAHLEMNIGYFMGLTAEKLAQEANITREEMDEYSLRSHRLAHRATEDGWLRKELLPLEVEVEGSRLVVDRDQSIRPDTSLEKLAALRPAFIENGRITAGNSSPFNAGASLVLLMSEHKLKEYGLAPLAKVRAMAWAGVPPSVMGKGNVPASRKALQRCGLKAGDVDLWEINEAFAAVVLYAIRELELDQERVNVHGGAIAIGHPLGATGARLVGTLARALKDGAGRFGVATACVGGGQGFAIALEAA